MNQGRCFIGCLIWIGIVVAMFGLIYKVAGITGVILLLAFLGSISIVVSLTKKAR